jgi:hypothetical protein
VLGGAAFVAISACTLTVDLEALEDRKCPGGQKFCDGTCVDTSNPRDGVVQRRPTPDRGLHEQPRGLRW